MRGLDPQPPVSQNILPELGGGEKNISTSLSQECLAVATKFSADVFSLAIFLPFIVTARGQLVQAITAL